MAKITITAISIENLGPFKERQTLQFNVSSGAPVILIKALNGSGKTTLLTAMQIGLYGYKAINAIRRTEYEQLIAGLRRQDTANSSAIEITVLIEANGTKRSVMVRREWEHDATFNENFAVLSNGTVDIELTETWDEYINGILPVELVQLFLFDGEKIEALANPERLPDLLRRATEVFLGLGGIDALENDLKAVERRAINRNKENTGEFSKASAEADHFKEQQEAVEQRIAILMQKEAALRNQLAQAQKALDQFTLKAKKQGIDAFKRASDLHADSDVLKFKLKEARAGLIDAASDPLLPLAWLGPLWEAYQAQWENDVHSNNTQLLAEEFKRRDARLLKALANVVPRDQHAVLTRTFKQDLVSYKTQVRAVPVLAPGPAPLDVQGRISKSTETINEKLHRLSKAELALNKAEKLVDAIPAQDQISEIFSELHNHAQAASKLESEVREVEKQLIEARATKDHVENRMNGALERLRSEFKGQALEGKSLEAAARAKEALHLFKGRLLASKALWLSEMITTEFKSLLRKRNFVSSVLVDPRSYEVKIEDTKGHTISMERLSAGERQILAIAVLSALIRERKGRFPVVVDTPLARLDRKHRESLIRNFFAKVSHQVMILSTDEEVEGSVHETLRPYVSAEYALAYNDQRRSTLAQLVTTIGMEAAA